MRDKVVLITGATSGIGRATAAALASRDMRLLVHGRDAGKGAQLVATLQRESGNDEIEFVRADLASLAEVRRLAQTVTTRAPRLDVLINNAGLAMDQRVMTVDGYETTFAVNHLAPFLLTNLLLDKLKASAPARVVTVSSAVHRTGRLDFDDLMGEKVALMQAYGASKLANILFTRALAKRLQGTEVTAYAVDPGLVRTNFGRGGQGVLAKTLPWLLSAFSKSAPEGAKTSVYLATAPELAGPSGSYYSKGRPATPSKRARDDAAAERLWQESAKLVGLSA